MLVIKAKCRQILTKKDPSKLLRITQKVLEGSSFVVFAYLYGSFLSWLQGEGSVPPGDMDLAIYIEDESHPLQAEVELMARLSRETGLPQEFFDVKVINEAPTYWAVKVMKEGRLVFNREQDLRLYEFMEEMARARRQLAFLEEAHAL